MLEGQLVLATVAQRFRLTAVPGQPNQPEAGITLRSPRALAMKLVARPETRDGAQPETDG
jgi:cytochrome P450